MNSYFKKLSVHPYPKKGESLAFYLARLAEITGWHIPKKLLTATGLKGKHVLSVDDGRLVEHVSNITGHDQAEILSACFPESDLLYKPTNSVYDYRRLYIATPRICPVCLSNRQFPLAKWQYLPHTYCLQHGQKLLYACPCCGYEFNWDGSLMLFGCLNCGATWANMSHPEQPTPSYLKHFLTLSKTDDSWVYMNDLMLAASRSIRPYDTIIEHLGHLSDDLKDWDRILHRAYQMLTQRAYIMNWTGSSFQARKEVRLLGTKALEYPIQVLQRELSSSWPIDDILKQLKNTHAPTRELEALGLSNLTTRKSIDETTADIDLRYHAKSQDVAELIGCRLLDLRLLVDSQLIKSINNPKQMRYAIFDLRTLANKVALINSPNRLSYIRLTRVVTSLSYFGLELGDILAAILNGSIMAHIDETESTLVEGLLVSPYSLARVLKKSLSSDPNEQIERNKIPKLFALTEVDLRSLAEKDVVYPIPCHRGQGCYIKKQLMDINNKYFIVSRWSKIRGLDPVLMRKKLAQKNITPVIGKNMYTKETKPYAVRIAQELGKQQLMTIIKPNRVF